VYEPAGGDYEFGDVFSAEWMFDIHLRGDAVPLKPFECRTGRNRPPTIGYQAAAPSPKRDLVLSHGKQRRAILLSENCVIESVLVRRAAGRLVFASVEPWTANDAEAEFLSFRRHPLPPGELFEGGVVNLENLFAVGHDALDADGEPRVARLDGDAALDLEIRWNAYAARRGPLAHLERAGKLAMLLTADGDSTLLRKMQDRTDGAQPEPESLDLTAANLLAETLTVAWFLEGGLLNDVSEAVERGESPDATRDAILTELANLLRLGEQAERALKATRRPADT
jgi:hypothetical protein